MDGPPAILLKGADGMAKQSKPTQRIVRVENEHQTSNGKFYELSIIPLPRDLFTTAWRLLKDHCGFFLKETKRWYCPVDRWGEYSTSLIELSVELDAEEAESEVGLSGVSRELYEAHIAPSGQGRVHA